MDGTAESSTLAKRKRADHRSSLACGSCRARKRRCNGARPVCSLCLSSKISCDWSHIDRRKADKKQKFLDRSGNESLCQHRDPVEPTASLPLGEELGYWFGPADPSVGNFPGTSTSEVPPSWSSIDWSQLHVDNLDLGTSSASLLSAIHSRVSSPGPGGAPSMAVPLQYIRVHGFTAISRGINRLRLILNLQGSREYQSQQMPRPLPRLSLNSTPVPRGLHAISSTVPTNTNEGLVDDGLFDGDLPRKFILDELMPIFWNQFQDCFPFLDRNDFGPSYGGWMAIPMMVNAMCALAARYSQHRSIVRDRPQSEAFSFGTEFADKAKSFLLPLVSCPSPPVAGALMMLGWHEFGLNCEGGIWMYHGMAIRMAIDLGLHRSSTRYQYEIHQRPMLDNLLWALCTMDRVLCISTGRPTTLREVEISIAYPPQSLPISQGKASAWSALVKLLRLAGLLAEAVSVIESSITAAHDVQSKGIACVSQLSYDGKPVSIPTFLEKLEDEIIAFGESLPTELTIGPRQLQESKEPHMLLYLHLWLPCLLLLLNREPISSFRIHKTRDSSSNKKMLATTVQGCKNVIEAINAVDAELICTVPFINHTIYLAGCVWLADLMDIDGQTNYSKDSEAQAEDELVRNAEKGASVSDLIGAQAQETRNRFYHRTASNEFEWYAGLLDKQTQYWAGASWVASVLRARRHASSEAPEARGKHDEPRTQSQLCELTVSLTDKNIIMRAHRNS